MRSVKTDGSPMMSGSDPPKIDEVRIDDELCAMILPARHDEPGIQFFTRSELSQQLASMSYSAGKIIPAHAHNAVQRRFSTLKRRYSSEKAKSGSIFSQNNRNIKQAVCLVRET